MRTPRPSARIGAGLAMMAVLAGCSAHGTELVASSGAGPDPAPVAEGTLVYGHQQEPPCVYGGWIEQGYLSHQVLDGLVSLSADGTVVPWLATDWHESDDHLTWTFTLQEGPTFSDGTPVDAQAVVTNIDPEHLDHYGTFDKVRAAFRAFVENVPFYGFAVMCLDHPEVQTLVSEIEDRRIITYGENIQSDMRFSNVRVDGAKSIFDATYRDRVTGETLEFKDLVLPMPGRHNVSNATAAIAVAHRLGITAEAIEKGLASFGGVKRRFTHTGQSGGVDVYDDYGHHPVEIRAVLSAARSAAKGRVIAVVQPHRYTRLQSLFPEFAGCFNDADTVVLAPVYAAGEEPIEFVNSEMLVERLKLGGHRDARLIEGPEELAPLVRQIARPNDMVVCLGAGSITSWAYALPGELDALEAKGTA